MSFGKDLLKIHPAVSEQPRQNKKKEEVTTVKHTAACSYSARLNNASYSLRLHPAACRRACT